MNNSIKVSDAVEVRVKVSEYKDELRLDIREYVTSEKYTGYTKKGVNLPLNALDDLIEILVGVREALD